MIEKLDLTKPLRWKCSPACVPLNAVKVGNDRYVLSHDKIKVGTVCNVYTSAQIAEELENVPERRTLDCYVNVYESVVAAYSTRTQADAASCDDRIACIQITQDYEVGEGL